MDPAFSLGRLGQERHPQGVGLNSLFREKSGIEKSRPEATVKVILEK